MNLAYFRKSSFDLEKTSQNIQNEVKDLGLQVLGQTKLPAGNGILLHICNPNWMGNLVASDMNLIGLLPCFVGIIKKNGEVQVGTGSPAILGNVTQNPAINQIAAEAEKTLKELIHKAAGVEPLKAVAVKLYSTTTCPFCKMEAAWLTDKKVKFEEVKVDLDQREAEEMVKKTGQMGVPVTAIKYENGEEQFVVGFDKPQLSQILEVN
jgi:glutaredoxin/uncharacterized protein (DUF302 family)